jgi:hypothetical protein
MTRRAKTAIQAEVDRIWRRCVNWGQLEAAAGVTDRSAFWKGKTEDEVRAEIRKLIEGRVTRGEIQSGGW